MRFAVRGRTAAGRVAREAVSEGRRLYAVQNVLNVAAPTPSLAQRGYDRPVAIVVAVGRGSPRSC